MDHCLSQRISRKRGKSHLLTAAPGTHSRSCLTLASPGANTPPPPLRHHHWPAWIPAHSISRGKALFVLIWQKLVQKPGDRRCLWDNLREEGSTCLLPLSPLCSTGNLAVCASTSQTLQLPCLSAARTRTGPVVPHCLWGRISSSQHCCSF